MTSDAEYVPAPKKRNTCFTCFIVILVAALGIGGCVGYTFLKSKPLYEKSMAMIKGPISDSLKTYDFAPLKSSGTPSFAENLETSGTREFAGKLREKLGPLQSVDESKVNWKVQYGTNSGVDVALPAQFEKGPGRLTLNFKKDGSDVRLNRLNVDSELLK